MRIMATAKVKKPAPEKIDLPALMRRARWLEKRLQEPGRTGRSYDEKEYAELLKVFAVSGVTYNTAEYPEGPLEEPPKIAETAEWVPGAKLGFRKAARFMPGGSV